VLCTRPVIEELVRGDTTFYLLGTAHVSKASIAEVRDAVARLRPDVVGVELDATRRDALVAGKGAGLAAAKKLLRDRKLLYLAAQLALGAYQRRIGARLGVRPGAEMLAALDAAKDLGARVALIDRDLEVTLRRAWNALSLGQRAMIAASIAVALVRVGPITADAVEQLKDPAARAEVIAELARAMPELKEAVLDERDRYMAERLVEAGRGARRVVAVVGAAHVPGMAAQLQTAA
jgi:pheromone shutdown-related protein TraB